MQLRVFEAFAGYGGASYGLKRVKEQHPNVNYRVVGYSELDKWASELKPLPGTDGQEWYWEQYYIGEYPLF